MAYYKKKAATRKVGRKMYRRRMARKMDGGKVGFMRNTLVPDRLLIKLNYKDNISLAGTSPATYAIKNFRLNSIYDPDLDIINGHQPLGYDQWQVFYNQYRVYKATVTCTVVNNNNGGIQAALLPYNTPGTINSIDDSAFEQPHVVSKIIAGQNGMNKVVLKKTFDIPRILGKSHVQYKSSDVTAAAFPTNPIEECRLAVIARQVNDNSAPACAAVISITYHCELFDRKQQALSYPQGKDPEGDFHTD